LESKEPEQNSAEPLHLAELKTPNARLLADRASIFQDLAFCIECCDELSEILIVARRGENVVQQALWTAALISYARCFASGARLGLTPAIYDKFDGEPRETHQMYIDMRNKHIAHSVNPFEQVKVAAVLSPPGNPIREVQGVATLSMKRISDEIEGVKQLRLMARSALGEVERLCKEQQQQVLEDAKLMLIEELYATAAPRTVVPEGKAAARRRRE